MENKITYDFVDVFSGIAPTPFVALDNKNIFYAGRWGDVSTIHLIGEITGRCPSFSGLVDSQRYLVDGFSKNFKTLSIYEGDNVLMSGEYSVIKNISFKESSYLNTVPFDIEIDIYNKNSWSGYFGILNPINEIEMKDGDNGTLSIKHSVSANGFDTSDIAFENAKAWVHQNSGLDIGMSPIFCKYHTLSSPFLSSVSESIDRIRGSYGIVENYLLDTKHSGYGILRYTSDISYSESDGLYTVSLKGEVVGNDLSLSRSRFSSLDLYSLAFDQYNRVTGGSSLSPFELNKKIDEDGNASKITFEVTYNDDPSPLVYVDYTVNIDESIEDGKIDVTLDASIFCKRGHPRQRYLEVLSYFNSSFFPISLARKYFYKKIYTVLGDPFLYGIIKSSTEHKEKDGYIKYRAVWSYPRSDISYSVNITMPKIKYSLSRPLCSSWLAEKAGQEFGLLSIKAKAVGVGAWYKARQALETAKGRVSFNNCNIFRVNSEQSTISSSNPYSAESEKTWDLRLN